MLLENIEIVLVKPRFPENIGMAARACANMGCPGLCLVSPELHNPEIESKLATAGGMPVLENMRICSTLEEAIADSNVVYGSTARIGGWRKNPCAPWQAASRICDDLRANLKISIVFGPEDRGLLNSEILPCKDLIHIRTFGASSLNLAQSVLLILYECAKAVHKMAPRHRETTNLGNEHISSLELGLLETELKDVMGTLDCMHAKNTDYYFMQWHGIICRAGLRRHEFDAMMGFCRQLKNRLKKLS